MPKPFRSLSIEDVARIVELSAESVDRQVVYKAVEAVASETCGFVLLTTLKYNEAEACVERLHSSNEAAYPIGGRKPLNRITASHSAMDHGEVFHAADRAAVQQAFFDHELIFSLGVTAILNAPIRFGARRLGTLNFCGEEGMYSFERIRSARILAGLLAPCLFAEAGG
jgi:hypothetical protein